MSNTPQSNSGDEQFKTIFEQLEHASAVQRIDILESLMLLVKNGASAALLGNYELGSYNLAMLVKDIPGIKNKRELDIIFAIIRLTIFAGADLNAQKAYIGNGGATCLEWLCLFLGGGIRKDIYIQQEDQYECCYEVFKLILDNGLYDTNPFPDFIQYLRYSSEVIALRDKAVLRMMYHGLSPISAEEQTSFAGMDFRWITLLFPYEIISLAPYVKAVKSSLHKEIVADLINNCTSSSKTRKAFKAFFSAGPHWLLAFITESFPETIFNLVKRNERELLIPFLKHFQPKIIQLKDEQGNTLLHQAILSRGLAEKTIQLLLQAKFSPDITNNEGLTPPALALKMNKTDLIKLF